MSISSFPELARQLHPISPRRAVVAAAQDEHTLEAVLQARQEGLIHPVLVGDSDKIHTACQSLGYHPASDSVIHAQGEEECAKAAVSLIRQGKGDMLIKGMLQTSTLLRAVLNEESGISAGKIMSHVAILDVPSYPKLLFITDGGMVIAPELAQKRAILHNAIELCRFLGYEIPYIAALCAVETVHQSMVETVEAAALKQAALAGEFGQCVLEGPISFDLATDAAAAALKGYQSPLAGQADILLVPSIAAGNLMAKALYGMAGGQMAGVVLGAQAPITINSRSATAAEKYYSILICAAMSKGQQAG